MKRQLGNFKFSGYDTVELAKEYGTPLYVLSHDLIRDRCEELRDKFINKYENTMAIYASKAFLSLAMCKIIQEEGLSLDVVSGGELYVAKQAKFPMERIVFHGNNKSDQEIKMAIEEGVGRIVADNEEDIDRIIDFSKMYNKEVSLLLRITPGVEGHTHKYIITGQKDSKFGISLKNDEIIRITKKILDSEYVKLSGFHFHLGSNLHQKDIYITSINYTLDFYRLLKDKLDFDAAELNVGGGFGIKYIDSDIVNPIEFFIDPIMESIINGCKQRDIRVPKVLIEPGRWIIGEAGITLYEIGTIKTIEGIRTYASIDGGMTDNPRPALYEARYNGIVANKVNEEKVMKATIAGKCCESGDILIWDLEVPKLERGDILAVLSTGAYNYSMASNYNKLTKPAVLLVGKEGKRIIVERESFEDLIKNDRY